VVLFAFWNTPFCFLSFPGAWFGFASLLSYSGFFFGLGVLDQRKEGLAMMRAKKHILDTSNTCSYQDGVVLFWQ
jgi:hypothetical protein